MAYRPLIKPYKVFDAVSMGANATSAVTVIPQNSLISYGFAWTGSSPVGDISIECSNDYELNADGSVKNAGTWNVMTLSYQGSAVTEIPVTGNTGNGFVDILLTGAYALRAVYSYTSGTGSLNGYINAKVT